jgi:hypothetical protein
LTIAEGSETFEFTESDATLRFDRHGHGMTITGSYAAGEITVSFTVFADQAKDFARGLDAELVAKRPEIKLNPVYEAFKLSGLSA